jgi:hypothetical protein
MQSGMQRHYLDTREGQIHEVGQIRKIHIQSRNGDARKCTGVLGLDRYCDGGADGIEGPTQLYVAAGTSAQFVTSQAPYAHTYLPAGVQLASGAHND